MTGHPQNGLTAVSGVARLQGVEELGVVCLQGVEGSYKAGHSRNGLMAIPGWLARRA